MDRAVAAPSFVPNLGLWDRRKIRRFALLSLAALGAAGTLLFSYHYWTAGRFEVSTDDAYVKADYTVVAPKVPGYIAEVLVRDNQRVRAGQVLARIDERDFRAALEQAQADLAAADATIGNINAQIAMQQAVVEQQQANIAAADAALGFAQKDDDRYQRLMAAGAGTIQRAQQAKTAVREDVAAVARDRAALLASQRQINVLTTERSKAVAQREHNRAVVEQARLNLSYTVIRAPVNGTVGARSVRVGQLVQAGTQLMAVVPLHAVYVVANFKETQLTRIRNGQPVDIEVDGFPGHSLKGHVDSLSPASGLEFALLPPDNATGNFTKIVQRIPVRIALDNDTLAGMLRPGMSVEPTIDTRHIAIAARDSGHATRTAAVLPRTYSN